MGKGDQTPRDRKRDSKKKNYENNGKYSAKHIRLKMNNQTSTTNSTKPTTSN